MPKITFDSRAAYKSFLSHEEPPAQRPLRNFSADRAFSQPTHQGGNSMDGKSFLIGALVVALLAGGYFYYDSTRSQVRIDAGGVKVQAD
jgi:hypothetical protein